MEEKNFRLIEHPADEVIKIITKYAQALGEYLQSLDETQRKSFRDLRGVAGVTTRTRQCQLGIHKAISEFNPEGLEQWSKEQKMQTNKQTKELIDTIEQYLQRNIIDELKGELGNEDEEWWYQGIPSTVRSKASSRQEEDRNKRGGKGYYLDLIDYKKIIVDNWELFGETFGFGKGNKDKRTEWLDFINEKRKIVSHASSGKTVSLEDFGRVEEYCHWLKDKHEKVDA